MKDILLTPIKETDIELIRNWRNSPGVSSYMYTDSEISEEEQKTWYNKTLTDATSKYWIIEYEGRKLGLAYLTDINTTFKSCFWAFYLGDISVRGAGIGAKVEFQVINYVFDELHLNKLRCEVFTFNDRVIKMHEKFGFRREAYFRQHCYKNGKFEDVVGLALLKSEWEQQKAALNAKIYGK